MSSPKMKQNLKPHTEHIGKPNNNLFNRKLNGILNLKLEFFHYTDKCKVQIKEPSLSDNEEASENKYNETRDETMRHASCGRTKKHLIDVSDKISTFTMECTSRLNRCSTWFCSRNNDTTIDRTRSPSVDVFQGPGPSPGSAGSCDDSVPPAKNCYRLVMLGSARVGKTSLVSRFLGGKFEDSYTPTIEDFHRKLYRIRGEVHQLDILDTSGNHPFPAMRRLSFLTGDLFVLCFSMDSRESFEEVIRLREQILETKLSAISGSSGRSKKNLPKVPMVIAGNKCDKEMKTVQREEAISYCATQDSSCVFVDCSAKKLQRVDDLFYELFNAANLPPEMAPNHHKRVSTAFGSPCTLPPHVPSDKSKKYTLSIKRRLSDACGVVAPNVRRPSIRTDLMIMRTKTCSLGDGEGAAAGGFARISRNSSGCVIQ